MWSGPILRMLQPLRSPQTLANYKVGLSTRQCFVGRACRHSVRPAQPVTFHLFPAVDTGSIRRCRPGLRSLPYRGGGGGYGCAGAGRTGAGSGSNPSSSSRPPFQAGRGAKLVRMASVMARTWEASSTT